MVLEKRIKKWRSWYASACVLAAVFVFLHVPGFFNPAQAQEGNGVEELWIDLSLGRPLVDLFNTTAREDDIARVEHISQIDLLDDVTTGQKLVVFKSAADAERLLPHIHDRLDIIGYNLEHGPANPFDEQADPVGSIMGLRRVADEYGLRIALGPDHNFALSHAEAMAPYADILVLQIQRVQTEPATVYDFVLPLISKVRRANPDIEISVQIRTEGEVDDLIALIEPLQDQLDGLSILTSVDTVLVAEELVEKLRGPAVNAGSPGSSGSNDDLPGTAQHLPPSETKRGTASAWTLAFLFGGAAVSLGLGYLGRHNERRSNR